MQTQVSAVAVMHANHEASKVCLILNLLEIKWMSAVQLHVQFGQELQEKKKPSNKS